MKKPRGTVSKPAPIKMDKRVVSAFMMTPSIDIFFKSWLGIVHQLDVGAEPKADDIAALLRNGEPPPPGETVILKYIADLIDGRPRGRPRKHPVQVEQHKRAQARKDIADIKARGLANFAKEKHHGVPESAAERYRKAKKTLRIARVEWDEFIENLRQRFNAAGGKMTKEEVTDILLASGLKPEEYIRIFSNGSALARLSLPRNTVELIQTCCEETWIPLKTINAE
jgi:uncharacterized protein YhaN